jgi:hypothetical protein
MLMNRIEDFGTNEDGTRNEEYCHFCFKDGYFTEPNITVNQKIDKMVEIGVSQMNMSKERAREMANHIIPKLKRWRQS